MRPGLLLGVNSNGDPSIPYTNGTTPASGTAYPMSMPTQQFAPTRTPHHGYGYDYGYTPIVPAGGGEIGNPPTWSLPNSSMRSVSHGRSMSSGSALSEDGDIEIDIEDEDEEYGRGRVMGRKGRNFNVEGDADGMDDDDDDNEDNDDDDEHYEGHNHGQNHEDDDHNDNDEEGTQTQTYHSHYTTTTTTRYNTPPHMKPKWDRGGLVELDIEMDMDMD